MNRQWWSSRETARSRRALSSVCILLTLFLLFSLSFTPALSLTCSTPFSVSNEIEFNAAIVCFNSVKTATADPYTILVDSDFTLTRSPFDVIDPGIAGARLLIKAEEAAVIDGQGIAGITGLIVDRADVTLENITLTNMTAHAIYNEGGTLHLLNTSLLNNQTDDHGGGLYSLNGNLELRGGQYIGNHALGDDHYGGAIYFNQGNIVIDNAALFEGNSAYFGGAIYLNNEFAPPGITQVIAGSRFHSNSVPHYGGAIFAAQFRTQSGYTIDSNIFFDNFAAQSGGALFLDNYDTAAMLTISNNGFVKNGVNFDGAGILTQNGYFSGTMVVHNNNFDRNIGHRIGGAYYGLSETATGNFTFSENNIYDNASGKGAGYYFESGNVSIENDTFQRNISVEDGGGIYGRNSTIAISDSLFEENLVTNTGLFIGGGAIFSTDSFLSLYNSTLRQNTAWQGGAIYTQRGTFDIRDTYFGDNVSVDSGGGIFGTATPLIARNLTFYGNVASRTGSALSFADSSNPITLINLTIDSNTTTDLSIAGEESAGAVFANAPVTVINSILSNNLPNECSTGWGDIFFEGINLVENPSATCPVPASVIVAQDPMLDPPADNGGNTLTMAIQQGSPVINVGDNSLVPADMLYDQRGSGFSRIMWGTVDLGAFESEYTGPGNQPPVAMATSPYPYYEDNDYNGSEPVTLDGSDSYDPEGGALRYVWTAMGLTLPEGEVITVDIPLGEYDITLTVIDPEGLEGSHETHITVNQPPVADAGPDQVVYDTDNSGSEIVTLDGSGSTDLIFGIMSYTWWEYQHPVAGGEITTIDLPVGIHTINLWVEDWGGSIGFDSVTITVEPGSPPTGRVTDGLLALYEFNEGSGSTVNDTGGSGTPLNLTIANAGNTSWDTGTLSINAATIVSSGGPADKLNNAIKASNELTFEAWVTAANVTQLGPARIMTLSQNQDLRNATLGQGASIFLPTAYNGRVRSTTTSLNAVPTVNTPGGLASTTLKHVVMTRTAAGDIRIYIDGVLVVTQANGGNLSNWDNGFAFALANELSNNRPWLGTYHLVAVYNRALTTEEVQQNYSVGPMDDSGMPENLPPVANAGPDQTVADNDNSGTELVTLDGSASFDPDGTLTSYSWRINGIEFSTDPSVGVNCSVGVTSYELVVTDDDGAQSSDSVHITVVAPENQPPVADAGSDINAVDYDNTGDEILTLDGSGSYDPDGTIVSYLWESGGLVISTNPSVHFNFNYGTTVVTLTVTDDDGATDTDDVSVTVNPPQLNPVADAGDDQVAEDTDNNGSEPVTLDGSGSYDPEGGALRYVWTAPGLTLPEGVSISFDFPLGTTEVTLTVIDPDGLEATDVVTITVNPGPGNQPPVADAGVDQNVVDADNSGSEPVTLDGTASYDPDGTIMGYRWIENGSDIASGATPVVEFSVGEHFITLEVTDDQGAFGFDVVVMTIQAGSTGPTRVTDGLLALYEFNEASGSTVTDTSGYGSPLNLTIANEGNVTWGAGTLTVNTATIVNSGSPAEKLISAIVASNELTFEAWVTAANVTQVGPARIMTLSLDQDNRDATLGQGASATTPTAYNGRVRSTTTTPNAVPTVSTSPGLATTTLKHIVMTRTTSGDIRIYVDGVLAVTQAVGGNLSNWNTSYEFALANELSLNRPWLGMYHLVAVYSRALSVDEVLQNFNAGAD